MAEFVNSKRLTHVPGSAHYDPALPCQTSKVSSPNKWSMSKSDRFPCRKNYYHPGPSEYTPNPVKTAPVYTMRPKPFIDPHKC